MRYLLFVLTSFLFITSHAQTREKGPWWPHPKWGTKDQAGASNWITPEKILTATQLVKTGKSYELGHVYDENMHTPSNRVYKLFIPSFPTYGPDATTGTVFNDEEIVASIGQVGTQFDGLGHPGKHMKMADGSEKDVFYNGFNTDDMKGPFGLQNLGIERVKPIITTGILLDIAASKNLLILPEGYEVNIQDVKAAIKKQGMKEEEITPGDAILFNFGWWRNWDKDYVMDDNKRPRISMEVVQWLAQKQPSMVGSDAILDGETFNVHMELTMKQGIFNLEWMHFDKIAEDKVYKFMFIFTPLPLKGATGSPGRPIAIR
jgi:kynurenine formamidase